VRYPGTVIWPGARVPKLRNRDALLSREAADLRSYADWIKSEVEKISDLAETERGQVRSATLLAYCRLRHPEYITRINDRAGTAIATVLVMAVAITASDLLLLIKVNDSALAFWPHYIVLIIAVCAGGGWASRQIFVRFWKYRGEFSADPQYYPFIMGLLLAVLAVLGPPVVIVGIGLDVPSRQWAPLAYAVALPALLAGLSGQIVLGRVYTLIEAAIRPRVRQRPLDIVVLWLAYLTVQADGGRRQWSRAAHIRALRRNIQAASWAVEHDRVLTRRIRLREIRLRFILQEDQRKLANLFRIHGDAFAAAKMVGQYDQICASLRAGLIAAVAGDWDALLVNAADSSPLGTLTRVGRVVGPSVLFLVFAIVVSWLPGVDPKSAGSARVLLVIAAALSAIPGAPAISNTVRATLEKALPWQGH
jgi:hypothetical protein